MTVSNTTNKHYYSGTGSQTSFPYAFKVFAKTDLTVFIDGVLKTVDVDESIQQPGEGDLAGLARLMRSRRSCRKFSDEEISSDLLRDLAKIGASAPSASNHQRWRCL